MRLWQVILAGAAMTCAAQAQTTVTRIFGSATPVASQRFAAAIWAGDTLYVSGQMADPLTHADPVKGTSAIYGDTATQTTSVLTKIQDTLKTQGLKMGDIVQMQCFVAADPAKGGKMDFAGLNAAYDKFFGTPDQPNKPVRATVQVAALVTDWGLVEIQVVAVKSKSSKQVIVQIQPTPKK